MIKITQNINLAVQLFFAVVLSSFIVFQASANDEAFLQAGEKAVSAGQYNKAIGHLTKAIEAGSLSPEQSAKAFYFRGLAYINKNEPARSIADFTSALFFKKNPASLKAKILVARAKAYRAVGLVGRAENDIRASGQAADTTIASVQRPSREIAARPVKRKAPSAFDTIPTRSYNEQPVVRKRPKRTVTQGWGASVKENPAPVQQRPQRFASVQPQRPSRNLQSDTSPSPQRNNSSGGSGQNYRSWFESSGAKRPQQRPVQRNNNYQTNRETPTARRVALANPGTDSIVTSESGRYRLQIAAISSGNDAREAWQRLVVKHSPLLTNHRPYFHRVDQGGGKYVVRIQIGPFADKLQTLQLCNKFKQNGLPCFLIVR